MKKIICLICFILSQFQIQSIEYWRYSYVDSKKHTVWVSLYKNESTKLYKSKTIFKNGKSISRIEFFRKGNPDEIIRKEYFFENDKAKYLYTYVEEDNKNYLKYTKWEQNDTGSLLTAYFKENPESCVEQREYRDTNDRMLFKEYYYKNRYTDCIKMIDYYLDEKVVKREAFFKDHPKFLILEIYYYESFEKGITSKAEQYFEGDPEGLKEIIAYFENGVEARVEQNFEGHPRGLKQIIIFYENGIISKEEQYFDNPSDAYWKIIQLYKYGREDRLLGYDKDGKLIYDK